MVYPAEKIMWPFKKKPKYLQAQIECPDKIDRQEMEGRINYFKPNYEMPIPEVYIRAFKEDK